MMKRLAQVTLVAAVVVMAAGSAAAQERQRQRQPGGGGGFGMFTANPMFLLNQKSVQDELKLSEEQVKKIKDLGEKQREAFGGLRDLSQEERRTKMRELTEQNQKALAGILDAKQSKRLKQISWQQMGTAAINAPEVAKALNLSDEQKDKLKDIQAKYREELRDAGRGEEARAKREQARKSADEKTLKVLTDDQKAKLKELKGEPFKGEITRPNFGGGRNRGEGAGRRPARRG